MKILNRKNIILRVFCCVCLTASLYFSNNNGPAFTTGVLAKNAADRKHDSLSQARMLSLNMTYSDKIPAYESYYYCLPFLNRVTFHLEATQIKHLKAAFFSDSGKKLIHTTLEKNRGEMTCSLTSSGQGQYIFLKLTNHSTSNLSMRISAKKTEKISSGTPPPHQQTKRKTTPKQATPTQTPASNPTAKASLYPHFLCIKQGSKKMLTLKGCEDSSIYKKCRWSSTNPDIAAVKKQTLYALSEGTAIIYLQSDDPAIANSTCLIRVISN